jgi:hypothetical protein
MPQQIKAETEPTQRYVGPVQPPLPKAKLDTPPAPVDMAVQPAAVEGFQPKVYQPQDIACCHQNDDLTNCGAEAGEPCKWQDAGLSGTYHAERVADAAAASQREGIKPTQEQFDQAVLDSGLV